MGNAERSSSRPHERSTRRCLGWAAVASLLLAGGCAHNQNSSESSAARAKRVETLEHQIDELEKTNGRLSTRLDQMEDEIFLLQDRVEAHRLALQRRGRMRRRTGDNARAQAPKPTPQTNYGGPRRRGKYKVRGHNTGPRGLHRRGRSSKQPMTRIPLSRQQAYAGSNHTPPRRNARENGGGSRTSPESSGEAQASTDDSETLVVTNEDFREFAKNTGGSSESGGSSDESHDPKKPVTDEKISTTGGVDKRAAGQQPKTSGSDGGAFDGKSGLDLYKSALATYRSGEYATALKGFDQFLTAGPRQDYRDNGLYWKGECYFGLGNYDRAIEQFQRVVQEQPNGNKVPDAMLKMALAFRELGRNQKARKVLEKLTRRYPSTNAGRLGEKKLSDLES